MNLNLLWILVILLFLYFLKESKNKVLRKAVGASLIGLGIFIMSIFPGLDDFLLYPIFSSFFNWELSLAGLKANFLPYTVYTFLLGIGISLLGIYIAGYKLSYLVNKVKRMFKKYI